MTGRQLARAIERATTVEECHALADRLLSAVRAAKARTKPKRTAGIERKAAKRGERRVYLAALRGIALARSDERCEFCREGLDGTWELHHVLSGGARRVEERPDTVAAVCRLCHREYHGCNMATLRNAKAWAIRHGFKDALRAIDHRIAKVEQARRTPYVPVRVEVR